MTRLLGIELRLLSSGWHHQVDNDPLRRAKACKAMPVAVVDTPDQVNAESGFLCLAIGDFELT